MTMQKTMTGVGLAAALAFTAFSLPASAAEKVTYLMPAPTFLPAFGPWMIAQGKGYYAAEDLDVTFESGRGGVDAAKNVGVGNAQVGGAIGDTPLIVRANGIPVKAVAQLGGGSLTQIVVPENSPIKTPADLKGKTISVMAYQDTTFYALLGTLAKVGLSKNDVNAQAAGPANVWKLLVAGQVDAMAGVPDWTGDVLESGMKIRIMNTGDYFQSMAQVIIASDQMIKERPELIRKLVRATLKGWEDIVKDPKAASVAYVKAVPQYKGKEAAMQRVFEMYNKYVYINQPKPGVIDSKRMAALQDFYISQGIVDKKIPVDELYTNQFVQ
jgi:NitT/TauT family transport system substrate-binding protein